METREPSKESITPQTAPSTPAGTVAETEKTLVDQPTEASVEAEAVAAEIAEAAEPAAEVADTPVEPVAATTTAEVVELARKLAAKDADEISREEVARLKGQFYAIHNAAVEAAHKAAMDEGAESYEVPANPDEEAFKQILTEIKDKKSARAAAVEAEQAANLAKKEALIAEINSLGSDIDNVNRQFPRFREIQTEFKAIGEVPAPNVTDIWKRYQEAVEHYYDQLKVNKDLRDYDFKKNLDTKLHLCDEAESLTKEGDVITAFRRLQELHNKWRETGPVAKEMREEIWNRFKDASAEINKKYQAYFEERKAREAENEAAKTAICERVEAIDLDSIKSFNAWNEMTKVILEAQEEWKKLGFASKKSNNALFARFRGVCDKFFTMKADYYRTVKDDLAANLARKTALCVEAEALQDSTDWKATADRLTELQKEWKTIGAVPKKQSDAIWARFQSACDKFFESKKKDLYESRHAEQANLKAKRALVASLRQIPDDASREMVLGAINEARTAWGEIGHVPFREKDKVYDDFRAAINELYKKHDLRGQRDNMARFESSINEITDGAKLSRERERLARVLEQKRSDLATYRNNLGFLSSKSASGSSIIKEMERKAQALESDIADLEQKIALIDDKTA